MDPIFKKYLHGLDAKVDQLLHAAGYSFDDLPSSGDMPASGVYLFSWRGRALYVGRSNRIRKRLSNHCRPSATHHQASFAFRLAKQRMGIRVASYTTDGSRSALSKKPQFKKAFDEAKAEVRGYTIQFVEERDQVRQTLLEIYAAIRLRARHNEFGTH